MIHPLPALPGNSRLHIFHIYPLQEAVIIKRIAELTEKFLEEWTAHKEELQSGFDILHKRFLVIAVNENEVIASGCSLDSLHRFIKSLEKEFNIKLLDRMLVSYRSGNYILTCSLAEFRTAVEQSRINADTIVFNTLIEKTAELGTTFEMPLRHSWLNNYLKTEELETNHHRIKP